MQRDHAPKRHHLSIDRRELEEFVGDDVFGQGWRGKPRLRRSVQPYLRRHACPPTRFPVPRRYVPRFPHPLPTRNVRARIQSLD